MVLQLVLGGDNGCCQVLCWGWRVPVTVLVMEEVPCEGGNSLAAIHDGIKSCYIVLWQCYSWWGMVASLYMDSIFWWFLLFWELTSFDLSFFLFSFFFFCFEVFFVGMLLCVRCVDVYVYLYYNEPSQPFYLSRFSRNFPSFLIFLESSPAF
jgi:hypothetical protein